MKRTELNAHYIENINKFWVKIVIKGRVKFIPLLLYGFYNWSLFDSDKKQNTNKIVKLSTAVEEVIMASRAPHDTIAIMPVTSPTAVIQAVRKSQDLSA